MEPALELRPMDIAGNATSFDSTANLDSPELTPRAWWRSNEDLTIYYGAEESIKYMRDFLASQTVPFDVSTTVAFFWLSFPCDPMGHNNTTVTYVGGFGI